MSTIQRVIRIANMVRRGGGVNAVARLASSAPRYLALYRRLLTDARVPTYAKAALLGAAGFAVSPLNIPNYIPVLGALDDLAIIGLANGFFLKQIPAAVLAEHRAAVGLTENDL